MKTHRFIGLVGGLALLSSCATAPPPQELLDARAAYLRASKGPTARLNPADLHAAKVTLDEAEAAYTNEGPSEKTKDAAYTAQRRVAIAEARANALASTREKERILAQADASEKATLQTTSAELGRTKEQLEAGRMALEAERERRMAAEKRASQAVADLARIATVKQETRGMVITLSGAVLFATGKSELLPAAQAKLREVARSLTQQDKDSKIIVEGHSDSQGPADMNLALSKKRAESVKAYLVSHGIAEDRVSAVGLGETKPIAANTSPEGRANNRRVEIVVEPPAKKP